MSTSVKPSSQDSRLAEVFGGTLADLYERAAVSPGAAALTRALELRGFLALAEEQVARVRDRVHEAMAPSRDMDELSAEELRFDAQWLAAALDARDGYLTALWQLLRTMPAQTAQPTSRPVRFAQPQITTTLPPHGGPGTTACRGGPGALTVGSPRLPDLTSTEIAGRIEDLYGVPLTDLEAHAQDQPPGMLAALLGMHHELVLAERTITFHRDRLARLVHPERQLGGHQVSHVLDCARRLTEAVAVHDVQARTVCAVLQSLHREPAPEDQAPARTRVPLAPPAVPATSSAPSR